jgi:CheY-like chemotaxis protein
MGNYTKYNLLIVDDEELLRDTIVFDFKRKGFTVFSADCGSKAVEIVKQNRIDLVISDMRMPGGDGMSLLKEIRSFSPDTPIVIFMTGFADISEQDCLAKGAHRVVQKPFDRKQLMSSVLDALGISQVA